MLDTGSSPQAKSTSSKRGQHLEAKGWDSKRMLCFPFPRTLFFWGGGGHSVRQKQICHQVSASGICFFLGHGVNSEECYGC
jgi:hypothetical protein